MVKFVWFLGLIGGLTMGCSADNSCQNDEALSVVDSSAKFLNQVVVNCRGTDTHEGVLSVYYPTHRVFLGTGKSDSLSSHLEYEPCYYLGGRGIPKKVLRFQGTSDKLLEVPGTQKRESGLRYGYAKRNDVVYRYDSSLKFNKALQCLDPLISSVDTELGSSYTTRAEMDQFINGSWTKLTRFRYARSMGFWFAPQDTVKLRIRLAAFEVHYYSDRVIIDGNEFSSGKDIQFEILKPRDGYWPAYSINQVVAPFFKEFQSAIVENGEEFSIEFALPPFSFSSTFDVIILKDGVRQPLRLVLTLKGPDATTPNYPDKVSDWPLVPAGMGSELDVVDLGFPGGVVYPLWAIDRLIELGSGFSACSSANREVYGEYKTKRYYELKGESSKN